MKGFPTFKGSWPWPWPWIGSYCIPSCITHRPLPTCQISLKSKKLFVDGRTYSRSSRTDGHLRPTFLGRLRRVDLIKRHHNAKFCAAQSHSGRDIAVLRIFKDDILWIKQRKNRFFYLVPGREQNLGWPSLKKKTKTTREWHFPSLPGRPHWDGRFELGHITDLNTYATFRDSKFRGFGVMYDTLNFVILHRNSWSHLKTV